MKTTRKYRDFDEEFKYLVRSKTDKDVEKSFNEEVVRATRFFVNHYLQGDSVETCQNKTKSSYGTIITDVMWVQLYKTLSR